MTSNIPRSLRALRQWVTFDIEGAKKIPYVVGSDRQAASNRPTDWSTFEEALAEVESGVRQHLGFAFSSSSGLTFIDLDDITDEEQQQVFDRIDTYAQRSVSGKGIHLIAEGSFEGPGRHPKQPHAGIFKENRFCLMTGDVIPNRTKVRTVPDEDLQTVHAWLSGGQSNNAEKYTLNTDPPEIPHQTIYEWGCDVFGNKYRDLAQGKWEEHPEYNGDHSSADYGLIAMLCDLTDSDAQVLDLFSMSKMWDAERAIKKAGHGFEGYVNRSIKKYRAKQKGKREMRAAVEIDMGPVEDEVVVNEEIPETGDTSMIDSLPEGLIKDIAQHSFESSYLPLQESAVCIALATLSVLSGGGYVTPTGEGLNVWPVLIGGTGCGKGGYKKGIAKIINALSTETPHCAHMLCGPVTSSAGLETAFKLSLEQISYNGEFGVTFNALASGADSINTMNLRNAILDVFDLAAEGGALLGRRTADRAGDRFRRPLMVMAGETSPEVLYEGLTSNAVLSGFAQRFLLVNVADSSRSSPNYDTAKPVPAEIIDALQGLVQQMTQWRVKEKTRRVSISDKALADMKAFSRKVLMLERHGEERPLIREIRNRSASKATRIASLLAVAANPAAPVIKQSHIKWAVDFVEKLDAELIEKFTNGDVSTGQVKQEAEIMKAIQHAMTLSVGKRRSSGMSLALAQSRALCPLTFIKRAVQGHPAFVNDRAGTVTALSNRLSSMVAVGELVMLDASDAADLGEPGKRIFYIPK